MRDPSESEARPDTQGGTHAAHQARRTPRFRPSRHATQRLIKPWLQRATDAKQVPKRPRATEEPHTDPMSKAPLTKRQREILSFYQQYIEEQGISPTLEEVAQSFGVNKVTIFGHVRELERKGYLVKADSHVSRAMGLADAEDEPRPRDLCVRIEGRVAAGSPIEACPDLEELDLADLIPPGGEVFALRVQGDSMIEDAIADGDLVLVERRSTARNGETVVAATPDGEVTLKRFYKEKGGVRLQPANARLQPMFFPSVEIQGVVVSVIRRL